MIRRNTWIMLGVFALVAAAAILLGRTQSAEAPGAEDATEPPLPLWGVSNDQIVRLRVESVQSGLAVELARDEETGWKMIEPEGEGVDAALVEQAVAGLTAPTPRFELKQAGALADYGLDPPQALLVITLAEGRRFSLEIGRETPTGGSVYARLADREDVLVFSSALFEPALALPESLLATQTPEPSETLTSETPPPAASPSPEG